MRLIKMLGLASVAAVAAMAFLGASSAMATFDTALCLEKSAELECPEEQRVHLFDMLAGTTILETSVATVLCLHSHGAFEVTSENLLGPAETGLLVEAEAGTLLWLNCGTNAEHNNCEVTTLKLPVFHVLKTEVDAGVATALGAEVHVVCPLVNCYYGGTVEGFTVESEKKVGEELISSMFNAEELPVPKVKGFLCPATSFWTALYEPTHLVTKGGEELPLPLWVRS